MDRLFRINFYPQDWLIDTAKLSPDLRGIYIQILCLIYSNRGPIDNDPKWIAGVSGCSMRFVQSAITRLSDLGFIQFSGFKISQKRAENELKSKREHLVNSSKGGSSKSEDIIRNKENRDLNSSDIQNPLSSPIAKEIAIAKEDSKKASRLPPNWLAPDEFRQWAIEHHHPVEVIKSELEKFRDYWIAQPGQKGVKLDWFATWRNWMRNARTASPAKPVEPPRRKFNPNDED